MAFNTTRQVLLRAWLSVCLSIETGRKNKVSHSALHPDRSCVDLGRGVGAVDRLHVQLQTGGENPTEAVFGYASGHLQVCRVAPRGDCGHRQHHGKHQHGLLGSEHNVALSIAMCDLLQHRLDSRCKLCEWGVGRAGQQHHVAHNVYVAAAEIDVCVGLDGFVWREDRVHHIQVRCGDTEAPAATFEFDNVHRGPLGRQQVGVLILSVALLTNLCCDDVLLLLR
mmetsp:Transcript_22887/g.56496  ORF Transcript_22887/g.56496 Transcript_22887/m.56496 type:complete len:224 (+) Transcript_22887:689-1360(+)